MYQTWKKVKPGQTWLLSFYIKAPAFYQHPPKMLLFLLIAFEYGFYEGKKGNFLLE